MFCFITVDLLVCHLCCFANCVSSSLQHVLFCQPCNFLFTTCFVLPTFIFLFTTCFVLSTVDLLVCHMFCFANVCLLVYNMVCFANRVTSYIQHVLVCQPCNFLFTTCFVLFCQPCIFLLTTCFALPTV